MQPDPEALNLLIRTIVEAVRPLRIVLFGSAARGEMGPDSDVDVLVVMPEGTDSVEMEMFLHTRLFSVPLAVDVVVATPGVLERQRSNLGLIYRDVLEEGREIYAA